MKSKKHVSKRIKMKQIFGIILLIAAIAMYLSSIFFYV